MSAAAVVAQKPNRWDVPFGPEMTTADVERLLSIEPFASIDPDRFPPSTPLAGILQNDTRILRYRDGDIVVREGDYGGSAFLVLRGAVRVTLESLPNSVLGRLERKQKGVFASLAQLWRNPGLPEVRRTYRASGEDKGLAARRGGGDETRVFLQDVPGVLDRYNTVRLGEAELFGELAALARTPRTATVFAEGDAELLEIRWQGLRDLRRRADALREYVDRRYRERGLLVHLNETPLLRRVPEGDLARIAEATRFETFGNFDWHGSYRSTAERGAVERLASEPLIAEEGHHPNGLILIRSGFARLSRRLGHGHRTLSYLGKGQVYGFEELAHNWRSDRQVPLLNSLRAVGYVDVLRIPTPVVERHLLPSLPEGELPALLDPGPEETAEAGRNDAEPGSRALSTSLLEFVVENRFINGTQTMMIDLDRCTRCDDCVRACAAAHDNNPRFVRHGPIQGHKMIANACMHCADPVCMIGCPTGAIHREPATGNVVINDQTCVGCATCANSCPYQNIRMVDIRDEAGQFVIDEATHTTIQKATKCDLCVDQLGGPACQRACPHDALRRVDMRDLGDESDWLRRRG